MRLTNKNTGNSFNLSPKETADFFYAKNGNGEFINSKDDYILKDTCREVSTFKFFITCISLFALCYAALYLYLQFNY